MEFERAGILGQTFTMRKAFITVFILSMAVIGNAQQEKSTTTKLAPPVLKNERSTPPKPKNFKYPPPVIKDERGNIVKPNAKTKKPAPPVLKKKSATSTKKGNSNQRKYAPPVIKADAEEKK
jgi:hypothetical protein